MSIGTACVDDARFVCTGGEVYACAKTGAVVVGTCAYGCVEEGEQEDDEAIDVAAKHPTGTRGAVEIRPFPEDES